jgi:nicotinamidase-related amidase
MMAQGSAGFQIVGELEPRDGEVLSDKIAMSAFESTFLNIALRDAHLDTFLIAGIALEVGIEPTVRHGLDLNFLPVVVSDACGSRSADLKERSLSTLEQTGEVVLATTDEVVGALAGT